MPGHVCPARAPKSCCAASPLASWLSTPGETPARPRLCERFWAAVVSDPLTSSMSSFDTARFTSTSRPPMLLREEHARSTASSVIKVTYPKPLGVPSRYFITCAAATGPYLSKCLRNSSSVVLQEIPPTKILVLMLPPGTRLTPREDRGGRGARPGPPRGRWRAGSSSPRGTARFTSTLRPSTMTCFWEATSLATLGSTKVTKPKPRGCCVLRSFMMTQSAMAPKRSKCARRLSVVVIQLRPPTKIFPSCCTGLAAAAPASPPSRSVLAGAAGSKGGWSSVWGVEGSDTAENMPSIVASSTSSAAAAARLEASGPWAAAGGGLSRL
mmetsp:Transcript_35502/g.87288  ORF Transcript_35502/g.87288 Transcript_35502/m.87288 type:complete len:326 (-) Transcript_35502:291-1268(-)